MAAHTWRILDMVAKHDEGASVDVKDKAQLEHELLAAQKQKVLAEIAVLQKNTPLTEAIKLLGSMVLGIGGTVAAVAGFQLAEVKAEKFKLEASQAQTLRDGAIKEIENLTVSRNALKQESSELNQRLELTKKEYATLSDQLARAQLQSKSSEVSATLQGIQQNINAADIELRTSTPAKRASTSDSNLQTVIEQLFAPTANVRGAAYEELMARFAKSPELVPQLLNYASAHMDNQNGVYNTLVVLGRLDHRALGSDLTAIRALAEKSRAIGAKTSERADKLLEHLPH